MRKIAGTAQRAALWSGEALPCAEEGYITGGDRKHPDPTGEPESSGTLPCLKRKLRETIPEDVLQDRFAVLLFAFGDGPLYLEGGLIFV